MKYIYLNEFWHAEAWVNGGEIPFYLASKYRSTERRGVRTPDENQVLALRNPITTRPPFLITHPDEEYRQIAWLTRLPDGRVEPRVADCGYVDGWILCMSNARNDELWCAEGKKACVEVRNEQELYGQVLARLLQKGAVDISVNPCCGRGECEYTDTAQRHAFLKSVDDSWQDEYRMFWRQDIARHPDPQVRITLPPGLCQLVWTAN